MPHLTPRHPASRLAIGLLAALVAGCGAVGGPGSTLVTGRAPASRPTPAWSPAPAVPLASPAEPEAPPVEAGPDDASLPALPPAVVEDQLIVAVAPGARTLLAADGAFSSVKTLEAGGRFQVVKLPAGMSREEAIARLSRQPGVGLVAPNRLYRATFTPNDPRLGEQWAARDDRAALEAAWGKRLDASRVTVAVLDTGVDYTHPELAGRVLRGPDLADGDADPRDVHGHGTHVAGIIGAAGNNAQGIAGVAWNCKLMAVKVLGDKGEGTTDEVLAGIKYAVDHGARVINMSLGTSDPVIDPVLHMGLEYAYKKGVLVVAAAGNDRKRQVGSPANDPYAVAVSSTSSFWRFEWFSTFSNSGEKVEMAAPGGSVLSLLPSQGSRLGKLYGKLSGTSMAAPYVAGAAALVFAQHPDWTPAQVRTRLRQAVDDKGAPGRDSKFGHGRINFKKLLD